MLLVLALLLSFQGPPQEQGDFLADDLVELTASDAGFHLDIRYAGANNFLGRPVYQQARAFLQRPAAEALSRAARRLEPAGYGIVIHDGYRPWSVTKLFWDMTPPAQRDFVANPARGSRHNRGCAVDVSLYERANGRVVQMPSLYDEMSERAYPDYSGGPAAARRLRELLRDAMEAEGFMVYEYEWWHFDYKDWRHYRISDVPFERMPARR